MECERFKCERCGEANRSLYGVKRGWPTNDLSSERWGLCLNCVIEITYYLGGFSYEALCTLVALTRRLVNAERD